jgi:hypothetical protein
MKERGGAHQEGGIMARPPMFDAFEFE